jgi:hypothetical protein
MCPAVLTKLDVMRAWSRFDQLSRDETADPVVGWVKS